MVEHSAYPPSWVEHKLEDKRLVQESSVRADHKTQFNAPSAAYLWLGDNHHLDRDEVVNLISHLKRWVDTGTLKPNHKDDECEYECDK